MTLELISNPRSDRYSVGNALAARLCFALEDRVVKIRLCDEADGFFRFDFRRDWIDLVIEARSIVIPVPVWNFGIPGALKDFIDRTGRKGLLWDLDENEERYGLLGSSGKSLYLIVTYRDEIVMKTDTADANDYVEIYVVSYLRTVFGSFGIDENKAFRVGGVHHSSGLVADKQYMRELTIRMLDKFGIDNRLYSGDSNGENSEDAP